MKTITNPILRGFNPDPSILRVGGDYFIATSTFEWFPGVQIHHSKILFIGNYSSARLTGFPNYTCSATPIQAASGRLAFLEATAYFT